MNQPQALGLYDMHRVYATLVLILNAGVDYDIARGDKASIKAKQDARARIYEKWDQRAAEIKAEQKK